MGNQANAFSWKCPGIHQENLGICVILFKRKAKYLLFIIFFFHFFLHNLFITYPAWRPLPQLPPVSPSLLLLP